LKILIIRLSSIGDIILITPVLEAIKDRYPEATLDFLVMDKFMDAISGNEHIDNLILFEKEKYKGLWGIINFSKKLKKNGYDIIIDLHSKVRSILISRIIGKKILRYKKRSWWKTLFVHLKLIRYHVDDTIVRNYFRPLNKLGIFYTHEKLKFDFKREDIESVKHFNNFIIMAPGAGNNTKKWPREYFAELGRRLKENIILIGENSEYNNLEYIRKEIGEKCKNLAGKLSLKESGALISRSKYIITNDSAPFHIARGVGKKVFVIFGPTDPGMFEYDENSIILHKDIKCSPCSLHGDKKCPKGHFNCMKTLTPEEVYGVVISSV
jgi:lipopolysaccharide heptosyltransferase II